MLEGVEDEHYTFPRNAPAAAVLPQQCLPDPSQCECYIFLYKNGRFVENLCECDHQSKLAQVELRNVHTPWPHGLSSCTRDAPHAKGNTALQLQPTHCRPAAPGMEMKGTARCKHAAANAAGRRHALRSMHGCTPAVVPLSNPQTVVAATSAEQTRTATTIVTICTTAKHSMRSQRLLH